MNLVESNKPSVDNLHFCDTEYAIISGKYVQLKMIASAKGTPYGKTLYL